MGLIFFNFIKVIFFIPLFFFSFLHGQTKDEAIILGILDKQTQAWNRGDVEQFMVGYLESDSLMYIGKSGVTYGYQRTLNNYKKNYDGPAQMGQLKFDILHLKPLGKKHYFVVGKWYLKRTVGDVGGYFTLIFQKVKRDWVIVSDHSS